MLSYMIALLQDVDNSMNSLYKSIDNDTELPKRIADTIQSAETNQDTPYNFGALHEQVTRRNDYITGKTGIGPFALNVTSNVLTYLFGVSFNPEREICKYTQIGRLDMSVDIDGNSIAAWISAFINAHVDIVKDPWVSKLNVNPYTYNLINLLVRSGYGEGALWFCIQPVIKAMAEASNNFSSKYTKSRKNKKSRNDVILEAASNITGNKYTEADIKKELRRKVDWQDERGDYHKVSYGTYCVIKVFDDIKNGNPIDQNEVLYAFFAIKPYSDALSNLVKYTKIDTRKQGKTFIEIQRYLDQYRRMFHEETSYGRILEMDKPIWDMDSLDRLINGSWIEFKTENGINEPLNVLQNQTFNGNKTFINNAIKYADKLIADDEEENTSKFLKSLSQAMITQIKSIFVNEYAKDNNINIKELFVGPNSMAIQLDRLKYLIQTDDRFKHLQNNALINALVSTPAKYDMKIGFKPVESPRFIKTIRKLDGGAIDENPLIDAWEDLLNDPRTLKFSRKLVVYAFVTSGESGKMGTLLKYLPPSFVRGELQNSTTDRGSFSDYISNVLANPHEIEDALNLDQIVQNNYTDYNFVSKTTLTYTDEKGQELNRFNFIKNEQDPLSPLVLIDTSNEVTAPYITVNKQGKRKFTNSAVDLNLYKKVERGVYILMPKRGYSDRDGNIYEYSEDYGFDFNQNIGYTYENYQNAFRYLSQFIRNVRKNNKTIDNYSIFYNTIVNRLLNNAVEANADADFQYIQNRLAEIKKEKEQNGEQQIAEPRIIQLENKETNAERHIISNTENNPNAYSMTSGGAYGADTAWDIYARKFGITNIFHYRDSKNVKLSSNLEKQGVKASSLTEEQMEYARQEMSKLIGRPLNDNVQDNLQARNYYQVTNADTIFAVATISGNSVKGGTNNAITAAKSMQKPIHVWDINTEKWYKYDYDTNSFVAEETPTLTERFAGIGSRDIQNYQVLKDDKWVSREQYVGDDKKKAALNAIREVFEKTFGKSATQQQQTNQLNTRQIYTGKIESLKSNQVFVFGSNTQGRHGKGAALTARSKFGAIYGQAEGPQGQSYAIITKDLTKSTHPSRTPEQIKEQIHKLYEFARQNPDKQFLVAYSGIGQNLNAYSNEEMASMFASENIPSNIVFEKEFNNLVNSAQQPAIITEIPQQNQLKTSVTYTPKGKTKQIYEVKEDSTGIHIFNKDGKEVFIEKGTADRNKIIANYKWQNGDAVVIEHGGHEYIVMRSGDKRVVIQRITGKTKKFGENDIERQEIIDKANKKFSEKDAANNMQSTISELDKLGEQRKKDCE